MITIMIIRYEKGVKFLYCHDIIYKWFGVLRQRNYELLLLRRYWRSKYSRYEVLYPGVDASFTINRFICTFTRKNDTLSKSRLGVS